MKTTLHLCALVLVAAHAATLHAATFFWDGGAATDEWVLAANWNPDGKPPDNGTADIVFDVNAGLAPFLDEAGIGPDILSLTFGSAAGAFTFGGPDRITLGSGGITHNDDSLQTINNGVALAAAQTWVATNVGGLTVNGGIITNGNLLTINANTGTTVTLGNRSGSGALTKNGAGTLLLSGSNISPASSVTLNAGTLAIGHDAALGTGTLTISGNNTLRADTAARTFANPVAFAGSGLIGIGGSLDLTFSGPVTLSMSDPTLNLSNAGLTTFSGVIGESGGPRELGVVGGGTLLLSGANTFSGGLSLNQGSTLAIGNDAAAGTGTLDLGGTIRADGVARTLSNPFFLAGEPTIGGSLDLTFSGPLSVFGGTLKVVNTGITTFSGPVIVGSNTLNITNAGFTIFSGVIDGSGGALVKDGVGTLRLGANSPAFTGATLVNEGTLLVSGNISGSSTTVNSGGTLGGAGTTGPATVASGGSLSPGGSAGPLTTGALTLQSGSFSLFELNTAGVVGGVNDLVTVNGAFTLDGTLVVTELAGFGNGIYRLFDYTGALTDNGLDLQGGFLAAHPGSSIDTGTTGQVKLVVVPEPGVSVLVAIAGASVCLCRRRALARRFAA